MQGLQGNVFTSKVTELTIRLTMMEGNKDWVPLAKLLEYVDKLCPKLEELNFSFQK
jgi:hypothetical protein